MKSLSVKDEIYHGVKGLAKERGVSVNELLRAFLYPELVAWEKSRKRSEQNKGKRQ